MHRTKSTPPATLLSALLLCPLATATPLTELQGTIRQEHLLQLASDPDGWDDLWVELQQVRDGEYRAPIGDRALDTDQDGFSDYEEMLLWRDPVQLDPLITQEEETARYKEEQQHALEAETRREAVRAMNRTIAAPWLQQPILDPRDNQPFSLESIHTTRRHKLNSDSAQIFTSMRQRRDSGRSSAQKLGMPIRFTTGGRTYKIQSEDRGRPVYVSPDNVIAADTVSADNLWPGGTTGLNLTGLPTSGDGPIVRIGVWEVNSPLTSHTSFSGPSGQRLSFVDISGDPLDIDEHSTHVSGTIINSASSSLAKGFAFSAEAHARDADNDAAELSQIFANSDALDDLFVSNHSYGFDLGWTNRDLGGYGVWIWDPNSFQYIYGPFPSPGVANYLYWDGDISISTTEDYRFGLYTETESYLLDSACYGAETLLPVWSAGNNRNDPTGTWHFEFDPTRGLVYNNFVRPPDGGAQGYDSLAPQKVAKNTLTVGSVNDLPGGWTPLSAVQVSTFSDCGPTDDGRVKPDLVANGEFVYSSSNTGGYVSLSGTSQAAPGVTGTLGLLVELIQRYRGASYQPPAALLKSVVIHTADDIGAVGPDYKSGWGLLNGQRAAELLNLNESSQNGQHIRMVLVQTGVPITIPVKAIGGQPLKATLVWTDPAGAPPPQVGNPPHPPLDPTNLMLVNDLDIKITSGTSVWSPYVLNPLSPAALATAAISLNGIPAPVRNFRDNVEQVRIASPVAGQTYNVILSTPPGEILVNDVFGGSPEPQLAALVLSGIAAPTTQQFRIVWFGETAANKITLLWPSVIGSVYRVQSSTTLLTGNWTDITSDIIAAQAFTAIELTKSGAERYYRVRKL